MDERFICRNGHRWGLSLEGSLPLNLRWICCPSCGVPPMSSWPLTIRQRFVSWLHRNPQIGLIGSILVLIATAAILIGSMWKEHKFQRSARRESPALETQSIP